MKGWVEEKNGVSAIGHGGGKYLQYNGLGRRLGCRKNVGRGGLFNIPTHVMLWILCCDASSFLSFFASKHCFFL